MMRSSLTESSAMALISINSVSMISGSRIATPAWHVPAPGSLCEPRPLALPPPPPPIGRIVGGALLVILGQLTSSARRDLALVERIGVMRGGVGVGNQIGRRHRSPPVDSPPVDRRPQDRLLYTDS